MLYAVSFIIVLLAGVYLVALGAVSLAAPLRAERFLLGFAGSPAKHYAELAIRLLIGCSILVQAPFLFYQNVFTALGWILVGTTTLLLFIPWTLHRRFAEQAVPAAARYLAIIGVVSSVLGFGVIASLVQSLAA